MLRAAGAARDLDLVETVLCGSTGEYTAARQAGHAGECTRLQAGAVAAATSPGTRAGVQSR